MTFTAWHCFVFFFIILKAVKKLSQKDSTFSILSSFLLKASWMKVFISL